MASRNMASYVKVLFCLIAMVSALHVEAENLCETKTSVRAQCAIQCTRVFSSVDPDKVCHYYDVFTLSDEPACTCGELNDINSEVEEEEEEEVGQITERENLGTTTTTFEIPQTSTTTTSEIPELTTTTATDVDDESDNSAAYLSFAWKLVNAIYDLYGDLN